MKQTKNEKEIIFGKHPKITMTVLNVACPIFLLLLANISLYTSFNIFSTIILFVISVICVTIALLIAVFLMNANGDESISNSWRIFSLISILMIICLFFASVYALMIIGDSSAFNIGAFPQPDYSLSPYMRTFLRAVDLLYFSIVTFTTLGYGDIYPVAWYAKVVVMIESFTFSVIIAFIFTNIKMKIKGGN